ncbi:prepilin-type N-terminal cleavage/methylation domain-containing protein [Desulfohalotomaculum tongense]|uniref:prepilin-type N-terminal cleavage/methylation domain-containing protein n=1 Tax=Desulforadius tongensis TaxID=1216062 RepID=UPI00195AB97B|nr:prepilin-type N-terminal cleavage/methylation domain-containing protein [Desulforadius tongensis]
MIISGDKNRRGFTLIELMLALMLTGLIVTAALFFMLHSHNIWRQGQKEIELQENVQIAMDKMCRDVRTCSQLMFESQNGFQLHSDSKVLNFKNGHKRVRYYVDDENELTREFSGMGLPVSSHIKKLRLEYYRPDGSTIAAGEPAGEVAVVKIILTGGMPGLKDITLITSVAIRTFQGSSVLQTTLPNEKKPRQPSAAANIFSEQLPGLERYHFAN